MSRYNQYGAYYDPAGSQSQQPTGYTYQASAPAPASYPTSSSTSSYQYGGGAYSNQQYGTTQDQQTASNSASHAAAALSSMSNQPYGQASSAGRNGANVQQYDGTNWYTPSANTGSYNCGNNMSSANRTHSTASPLYATAQPASSFGTIKLPEQPQSSASSNTLGASSTYRTAPSSTAASAYQSGSTQSQQQQQQQQQQPPRYNSPLQAVQAQRHAHAKQPSRSRESEQASPQMRNASASHSGYSAPLPATVDPSQVYDNRAELQRRAEVEAERKRKADAKQAAKKAEEERLAAEAQKADEAKQEAEMKEAAKKKAEAERRKLAREEKKRSKSAATALTDMASSSAIEEATTGEGNASSDAPKNKEEEEMRAMFQKMREFNAKNPAMLARLWEEERSTHSQAGPSSSKAGPKAAVQSQKSASASKPTTPSVAPSAAATTAPTAAPSVAAALDPATGIRPFVKAPQPSTKPSVHIQGKELPPMPGGSPFARALAGPNPHAKPVGSTLWPSHKKGALADATARWLHAQPGNADSKVTPGMVFIILNENPSYVQLCEALEALGMIFERTSLARELLRAVPDGKPYAPLATTESTKMFGPLPSSMNILANDVSRKKANELYREVKARKEAANSAEAAKSGKAATTTKAPGTVSYEAPSSLSEAMTRLVSAGQGTVRPPSYPTQPLQSPHVPAPYPLSQSNRVQSAASEIKPETKPQAPPKPPANKEEAARKRTFGDLVDLTAEDSEDQQPEPQHKRANLMSQHDDLVLPFTTAVEAVNALPSREAAATQIADSRISFAMWQPPSARFATLPSQPQQVQTAALQPPPPQQAPVIPSHRGPSAEQLQHSRLRGKMLVEPIMRDRVARKSHYDSRTIARDVLLATGRHPDMRGLNAHMSNMHKLLGAHGGESDAGGVRADLSTIKWDIIDPVPEAKIRAKGEDEKTSADVVNGIVANGTTHASPSVKVQATATVAYEVPTSNTSSELRKPRGRPIGSGKLRPGTPLTNGLGTASASATPPSTRLASQTNANATPTMPTNKPVGYSAFREIADDGTVVKKKGRPVGWRKHIHSREAQGLPPSTNEHKKKEPKADAPLQEPAWQVYKCKWAHCGVELHNLETLRKHITKLHGISGEGGVYQCWWKGCASHRPNGAVASFGKVEDWLEHIKNEHLRPIAWKLGDGPRVKVPSVRNSDPTPSWLLDQYGRSVTPVITPTPPPDSGSDLSAEIAATSSAPVAQPLRGRPPKYGNSKSDVSAPLRDLEIHQAAVGVTMDRMGCILASDERRAVFLDDEDFEDEVFGSEFDDSSENEE